MQVPQAREKLELEDIRTRDGNDDRVIALELRAKLRIGGESGIVWLQVPLDGIVRAKLPKLKNRQGGNRDTERDHPPTVIADPAAPGREAFRKEDPKISVLAHLLCADTIWSLALSING
jgi:hypothetical protein